MLQCYTTLQGIPKFFDASQNVTSRTALRPPPNPIQLTDPPTFLPTVALSFSHRPPNAPRPSCVPLNKITIAHPYRTCAHSHDIFALYRKDYIFLLRTPVCRRGRHGRRKEMTTENGTCVLCGRPITGWGNNPYPLAEDGECCDQCNNLVVQARLIRAIRAQGGAL